MSNKAGSARRPLAWLPWLLAAAASGQSNPSSLSIKAIAEVEVSTAAAGRQQPKLVAAGRVVPGDALVYTLEVRNISAATLLMPSVTNPIPEHMRYVADSAVGPGTEVSYSVDGGRTFDAPEKLQVVGADGQPRAAVAGDYTHIRWQLRASLKGNSVAFVRFRAVVK